jgi:hypothetical protein
MISLYHFCLGGYCLIEQWDFARHDQVFVRTAVTPVQPERA